MFRIRVHTPGTFDLVEPHELHGVIPWSKLYITECSVEYSWEGDEYFSTRNHIKFQAAKAYQAILFLADYLGIHVEKWDPFREWDIDYGNNHLGTFEDELGGIIVLKVYLSEDFKHVLSSLVISDLITEDDQVSKNYSRMQFTNSRMPTKIWLEFAEKIVLESFTMFMTCKIEEEKHKEWRADYVQQIANLHKVTKQIREKLDAL